MAHFVRGAEVYIEIDSGTVTAAVVGRRRTYVLHTAHAASRLARAVRRASLAQPFCIIPYHGNLLGWWLFRA